MEGIRRRSTCLVEYARDTKTEAVFPEEMRRGKGKSRSKAGAAKTVEGAKCPLCGKPVQENSKAFGCSGWREGCHFTLWKDGLKRGGGPELTEKLVQLVLEKGAVAGSTGTIRMADGQLSFTPKGLDAPSVTFPVVYSKK